MALAERGATIAVGARRAIGRAIEELDDAADQLFYQRLDVADVDSIDAFMDGLASAYGYADILVNSAGVTAHEFVCGHDEQSWLDVIDINLSGPFRMIRACLPKMIERPLGSHHQHRLDRGDHRGRGPCGLLRFQVRIARSESSGRAGRRAARGQLGGHQPDLGADRNVR